MLLTLATHSYANHLATAPKVDGEVVEPRAMLEMPEYAIRHLQLRGLNVPASMLSGWPIDDLDRFRDRADKAGCPCLVLVEDTPLAFAARDPARRAAAADRVKRLAVAAHRLGCNALAMTFEGPDTDEAFGLVADGVKDVMPFIERMELNVLLAPHKGLTAAPDRLIDLIKRIGGFRIGSLPSFGHALETGDAVTTLRKLAPYAGAVHATIDGFTKAGKHRGCDLAECVSAIRSVGFVNTLAIDYRGTDDPTSDIEKARELLQAAIDAES